MKYNISNEIIPQEQRKEINDTIMYIINNNISENESGITKEDIFNAYTGIGGLHGLEFKNYGNYYDYQKAKAEIEQGQFFTPYKLAQWIYDCLHVTENDLVADLTCGHGSFINSAPVEKNFYGCELELKSCKVAQYLYPEAHIKNCDIRLYDPGILFDYIIGNPPYNLRWYDGSTSYASELYYCLKAADLLKPAGIMAIIVPQSFCADYFSDGGMIKEIEKKFNMICQIPLDKNTFSHLGVHNYATKCIFMQRKSEYIEDIPFNTSLYETNSCDEVWNKFIRPIREMKDSISRKIFLETVRNGKEDKAWTDKVEKILYDIKRNPLVNNDYASCVACVEKYRTQKKPDYMTFEEWQKSKITKDDVIRHLKHVLKAQNRPNNRENRVIKNRYSFEYNGLKMPISDIVADQCNVPIEVQNSQEYKKVIDQKRRKYNRQSADFSHMKQDHSLSVWLDNFELSDGEDTIRLNDNQKHDINLFLQKDYSFIQWEQGCGKTFAGISIGQYRMENCHSKCIFVVSTAISIKNNWVDVLTQYGIDFVLVEKLSDISVENFSGKFVLITLNMMVKYHKFIKKYVQRISQKATLIFDESDNISNQSSKRTKAVLNAFRRLKYKVLMTGTSTRNNIAEIFPQLELLYNNSYNMFNECLMIQRINKDTNELEWQGNDMYMRPYPSYKKGYKLFTEGHIPEKITVFGVGQITQDVFNSEVLKATINKTMITRTFEEITGKKLYEIKQETCHMGSAEMQLYKTALDEFYKLEYLFATTGNARKDAMLKILNQLNTLLKICASPQSFKEYNATTSNKFNKVLSLVGENSDSRIAIGVRHKDVVKEYERAIRSAFPGREVFTIIGAEVPLKKRKEICKKLKATKNGILISTQQSLSASMNIDFVDKCIIPELHWNNSSMSQYYFRFIRYTSQNFKTVYFVTYDNSIESNLLKMILVKDKLNRFMKNQDSTDDEIYDIFGVDENMLKNLMYKEKTEEGYVIRWGNQQLS